jgi:hypothetical protein
MSATGYATAAFRIPAEDKFRSVVKFLTFDLDLVDDCERLTVMVEPFSDCEVLWVCAEGFTQPGASNQIARVRELLPATFPGYEYTEV